jgi:hypothetical protein
VATSNLAVIEQFNVIFFSVNIQWLYLLLASPCDNDLKSMGVKRWRKKAEDRLVWAVLLKEALVKL